MLIRLIRPLIRILQKTKKMIEKIDSLQGSTLIAVHNGKQSGQEVPHVHVHVIPRTAGDGGGTLMAMWPSTPNTGEVNHDYLADTAARLAGVE
mgnify:CR=1 FL=1